MIQRIKSHNVLNGIKFSIVEYIIIVSIISPFAAYYILHMQVISALISLGIILNCLTVAVFGFRQWFDKEQGIGWRRLLDKDERDRAKRANPHMLKDTTIITITSLVPYVLILLVAYDLMSRGNERKT